MLPPSGGRLIWKDQDVTGRAPHQVAELGIVKTFQNPQLFPELSVIEHVWIAAHLRLKRMLGSRRVATLIKSAPDDGTLQQQIDTVLRLCRLNEARDELALSLSYGDEKMLGVAMALMCEPELLLLDEPATGLGHNEITNLGEVLRNLRGHGTTLCIIDHNVGFLGGLADRAIAMHHGSKIAEGMPSAVLADKAVIEAYLGRRHA
jgi:branched-chain amino acid transport system ATP-binding protein